MKSLDVKIIDNAKFQTGFGEGICLVLTQLLDKYLINQNFIFKKPKLNVDEVKEIQSDFEEVILEDNGNAYLNPPITDKPQSHGQSGSSKTYNYSAGKRYSAISSATTQGENSYIIFKRLMCTLGLAQKLRTLRSLNLTQLWNPILIL